MEVSFEGEDGMNWKEEIKKKDDEVFREFTDALIKLERALSDIQEIGIYQDSVEEAEVAVKNAILDIEKRFEQYKRELRR